MGFVKTIDVAITGTCNLRCKFCWGVPHEMGSPLATGEWEVILSNLYRFGVRRLVISGGEPLLRNDLPELLAYARSLGFRITLSTNAILFMARGKQLLHLLDEIGIPIDGHDEESSATMRVGTPVQFKSAIGAIKYIRENNKNIHLTIRTVATKLNHKSLVKIGNLITELSLNPNRWKIYQFSPVSYGEKSRDKFYLTENEFNEIGAQVLSENKNINIELFPIPRTGGRYVFLMPDGRLSTIADFRYNDLGDFLHSPDETITSFNKFASKREDYVENNIHGIV